MDALPRWATMFVAVLATSMPCSAASLSGRVLAVADGAPIAGVVVEAQRLFVHDPRPAPVSAVAAGDGSWTIVGLEAGHYHVRTRNTGPWFDARWPDARCVGRDCVETTQGQSQPIELGADETRNAIDFRLFPGTRVVVHARDSTTALAPYDHAGATRLLVHDASGALQSSHAFVQGSLPADELVLEPGTHYLLVDNTLYEPRAHDDTACGDPCNPDATPPFLAVEGASLTASVSLVPRYGLVRGRVTDTAGAGLAMPVRAGLSGIYRSETRSAPDGRYELAALPGPTHVAALPEYPQDYASEVFGDLLEIETGSVHESIDFRLLRLGRIAGRVTNAEGAPMSAVTVSASGGGSSRTNLDGRYVIERLRPGSYGVAAAAAGLFFGEPYRPADCPDCAPADPRTRVEVREGETTAGIDIVLTRRGGFIYGGMRAAGASWPSAWVTVVDAWGTQVASVPAQSWGYETPVLPYGTYRLVAHSLTHFSEVYRERSCVAGCVVGEGEAVTLSEAQPVQSADFTLERGAELAIDVRDVRTGARLLPMFGVALRSATRGFVPSTALKCEFRSPPTGPFVCHAPPDTYQVLVSMPGYRNAWFPDVGCERGPCADGAGDWVTLGAEGTSIAVALAPMGGIDGSIDGRTWGYPASYVAEVFDAAGDLVASPFQFSGSVSFGVDLDPGRYYVRTRNARFYVDQLHAGIPCPAGACSPTAGTPVDVVGTDRPRVVFELGRRDVLRVLGFENGE